MFESPEAFGRVDSFCANVSRIQRCLASLVLVFLQQQTGHERLADGP